MSTCSWTHRIEAYHDGEATAAHGVAEHLEACADCREYLGLLQQVSGAITATKHAPEIADAQFRVFMDGIREGIEAKPSAWGAFFSKLSLYAAGFLLVAALSYIFTSGPVRTWADQVLNGGASEDTLTISPASGVEGVNSPTKKDLE
jgi:predicted anti-sigma-YlaC factor YlaD